MQIFEDLTDEDCVKRSWEFVAGCFSEVLSEVECHDISSTKNEMLYYNQSMATSIQDIACTPREVSRIGRGMLTSIIDQGRDFISECLEMNPHSSERVGSVMASNSFEYRPWALAKMQMLYGLLIEKMGIYGDVGFGTAYGWLLRLKKTRMACDSPDLSLDSGAAHNIVMNTEPIGSWREGELRRCLEGRSEGFGDASPSDTLDELEKELESL
jgi:hypothetical protein